MKKSIIDAQYSQTPDADRNKREAFEELFALEPTPVPKNKDWKREYESRKTKTEGRG